MQAEDWEDPDRQNQDTYDELLAAIEASDNQLSLLIAVCNDPGLQAEIIQRYETDLAPDFRHYRLTLARGEPSLKAAINQALAENIKLQAGKAVLTLTGIEQLYLLRFGKKQSEQELFFNYLQWTRESLRSFPFPIVIWVTHQILHKLSRESPDFWSWRRGVFRFIASSITITIDRRSPGLRYNLELAEDDETQFSLEDLQNVVIQKLIRGGEDSILASLYTSIGKAYISRLENGKSEDYRVDASLAVEHFQKAAMLQKKLGLSVELVDTLDNLANFYESRGLYVEAELLYVEALELRKRLLGNENIDVAVNLSELARIYHSQELYTKAECFYVQALELRRQLLGDKHPDVATSIDELAGLYESQQRYGEAERFYIQALELRRRLLGDDHPDVANSLNNLANFYESLGRYVEAEAFYIQALEVGKLFLQGDELNLVNSMTKERIDE